MSRKKVLETSEKHSIELHKSKSGYKGKNISVGIGVSNLQDGYKAGSSAAKQAARQSSKGIQPSFSLVFVSSKYNPQIKEVVKGVNKILGTNWVGCTTDRELNSILGYSEGTIEVLCLDTKYMHLGVGVADNYRDNPQKKGEEATRMAIENCPVERSIFATTQFMRGTKKGFADIVRNPPYFILTFVGGTKYSQGNPLPGRETEFLNGIFSAVGAHIPIVGASASSDFNDLTKSIAGNYQFANGAVYSDAAIVTFVVSDLYFSYGLKHGYKPTSRIVLLSKLSGEGRIIEKLNGKNAVEEYCRILDISTREFLKNPWRHTFPNPLATIDSDGNIYLRTIATNPDKKTFSTIPKLVENSFADIPSYDFNNVINAMSDSISQAKQGHENKKIAISLVFSCSSRRVVLGKNLEEVFNLVKSNHGKINLFGFYTFGEIGARKNGFTQFNNQTITSLTIFDRLLTE